MAPDYVFRTIGAHSYHSTLVPCFVSLRGSTYHGIIQVMIGFGSSMTCFLFQLQIILSIVRQRATTFGELARFIYCLLQKIKQGSSLPLVEQWDDYVLPNHSKFPPIADGQFLARTRVLAALNKIGSSYLKREFQRGACKFLEEFTTSVLSTVPARSKIGQGLSCFCPAIIVGGDNHAPLHLLGLLLDGLLDHGWVKGSEI